MASAEIAKAPRHIGLRVVTAASGARRGPQHRGKCRVKFGCACHGLEVQRACLPAGKPQPANFRSRPDAGLRPGDGTSEPRCRFRVSHGCRQRGMRATAGIEHAWLSRRAVLEVEGVLDEVIAQLGGILVVASAESNGTPDDSKVANRRAAYRNVPSITTTSVEFSCIRTLCEAWRIGKENRLWPLVPLPIRRTPQAVEKWRGASGTGRQRLPASVKGRNRSAHRLSGSSSRHGRGVLTL